MQDAADSVFVEFSAGKGYLSSMICDSCPARKVVMLDRQSFKLKADRCDTHSCCPCLRG